MSIKSLVKQVLIGQQNKRYEKLLTAAKSTYDAWIRKVEAQESVVAECTAKEASNVECSEFVYFLKPGAKLAANALSKITKVFAENPQVQIIYGDEDVQDASGKRFHPWFKPDWSPDLFQTYFYLGSLVAVRKDLAGAESETPLTTERICDYVVRAGGFGKNCRAIYHLPQILCHNESREQMERWLTVSGGKYGVPRQGEVPEADLRKEKISVIIPSKDHPKLLETCFYGIAQAAGNVDYEIIVVDNGSSEENKKRIEMLVENFKKTAGQGLETIQYLYEPMEFNFSRMCNLGVKGATGELLLFLNDDVELCEKNTLPKMAELAMQEYTGAVGLKLYYPDSIRIQHAGVTNLPMGPVHKLQFLEDNISYYFDSNRGLRNVLAVTAACLMVSRKKFLEAGAFSEDLQVAFNDVDLCYTLYELGYHNVCRNDGFAYHHESLSRGDDESTEKWLRLMEERKRLYEKHPRLEGEDPYFGAGLLREGLDSRIRPVYETAGNVIQKAEMLSWHKKEEDCRRDNCLMVRVEACSSTQISGYGVVLGDNNACYEFELLLKNVDTLKIYAVTLNGQYRPDLVENMPDQVNVGLCGFATECEFAGLESGNYQIGMVAKNRVNGLCLINYSSRILKF